MRRVLIIETDDRMADETAEALHAAGHWPVSRAKCFQSAMAAVDGNAVDVAIVDSALADGDSGADVARALKEHYGIDVILISEEDTANRPLMDIEHRFVRKPVDPAILATLAGPCPDRRAA